jgi:alpha-glucosidase
LRAAIAVATGGAAAFDVGQGATITVRILDHDLGRVTLRRAGGFRLDRGWSLAPGGIEPPYGGRDRDDLWGFANPGVTVTPADGIVKVAAAGLTAEVTLRPFGIAWRRDG